MVLDCIVKECRDRLILGCSVLEGDARRAQKVGEVRNAGALADVAGMEPCGEDKGILESLAEQHSIRPPSYGDKSGCSQRATGLSTPAKKVGSPYVNSMRKPSTSR